MSDGGKGSAPRPLSVDHKTFEENWDAIFGNSKRDARGGNDNILSGGVRGGEAGSQTSPEHEPGQRRTRNGLCWLVDERTK